MRKRILITAGGTGGHIYPAQGFAQQLMKLAPDSEILFVAGGLKSNRYFDHQMPHQEVACGPLLSKNPLRLVRGLFNNCKGVRQSMQVMRSYRPHIVVGFGSYYTVPILLAAKLLNIPIILHEANSIPGKANQWFAPYAEYVGIHFPFTASRMKGRTVEVGMPLREGYRQCSISTAAARHYFELDHSVPTLLIFGGSQGAQSINQFIQQCLTDPTDPISLKFQIIHLTGDEASVSAFTHLYAQHGIKACVKAFERKMNLAWKASDLFVGRSGASTIAEAIEFEVPGILIPYPYATENHQEKNADFLVQEVKGAIKLCEKDLTAILLKKELIKQLQVDRLQHMRQAIQAYKQRPSQLDLGRLVLKCMEQRN